MSNIVKILRDLTCATCTFKGSVVQWLPWFSGPNGQVNGSMVLESPRDSDWVSVVRGIDEALQAKLDR